MQMSKQHHEPGSAWLRDTDLFTSSYSEFERKKCSLFCLLYLQESFHNSFVIFLLAGLVCEHGENSKLIFHLKYFYFCLFSTSISLSRPQLKLLHATKVYLSAWKLWRKVSYRTASHHLMRGSCVFVPLGCVSAAAPVQVKDSVSVGQSRAA